jgi:ubiquinone/menaquinone biosynthesis C-methylase UbiE
MRFFFHHFYHSFAGTYDFVAATVSVGRWTNWIESAIPFMRGTRILELGHGPGHLQRSLRDRSLFAVGLDESPQMARLAKRHAGGRANLTRGVAQSLPFAAQTFDTVVSTFPSEFIFDSQTISEAQRVLRQSGRVVLLPAAWIVGRKTIDRLAAWLFRVTGEAPVNVVDIITERAVRPLEKAGFETEIRQIEIDSSVVLVVLADKR